MKKLQIKIQKYWLFSATFFLVIYGSAKKAWREKAKQNKTNKQTNKQNEQICQIQVQPIAVRKQNVS